MEQTLLADWMMSAKERIGGRVDILVATGKDEKIMGPGASF